jgi:hypothetical protein
MGAHNAEVEKKSPAEIGRPGQFSLPVEIEGLSYLFRGTTPDKPSWFSFSVHIPDSIREQLATQIVGLELPEIKKGSDVAQRALEHFLADGQVGHVYIEDTRTHGIADTSIGYIASDTWLAPSPYTDAQGVGRFLMNNMLTFLDIRGWSAYVEILANGRLSQKAVCDWYERKGFKGESIVSIRRPQAPDITQPIARILGLV